MAFIAAEIRSFFEDADYLGLSARTAQAFAMEGVVTPEDLADFNKDGFEQIYRNLRKPAKVLQGGDGRGQGGAGRGRGGHGRGAAAAAPAVAVWVEVEPYVVPAKSQMRIRIEPKPDRIEPKSILWISNDCDHFGPRRNLEPPK
jgi:hypothetical protein